MKLWLCGIWRGNREMLEKTILPVIKYFDGIIACVDSRAAQSDIDWLNLIKGDGKIIVKDWVNDHAHTSNEVLLSGIMDYPDYFVWIDESDQLNENFAKNLKEDIQYWDKNNVGQVYLDHPFILRFHDGLRFPSQATPHWTISNVIGNTVNLSAINGYCKEKYVVNNRDTLKSAFLSPSKYWFSYPNFSNHTSLLYNQFSPQIAEKHEYIRINFRHYCKYQLGIPLDLDCLITYMMGNVGKYPEYFEQILELEVNLKDIFRLFVLKEPWVNLHNNRFDWSYFKWKSTNEIIQPKDGSYRGIFNQYKTNKGEQPE